MSKIITLNRLSDFLTNLKELFVTKTDAESIYETKANAANIYETKEDAATHLTKTDAANIYETKEDAATHLTKTEASETYITKADAADTYESKIDAATHLTKTEAADTYVTKDELGRIYEGKEDTATYLTKTEASETYITKADAADTYTELASSAIRAQWYAAFPDGAEAHNAMWGGRDITAAFNNGTVSANIANGTFKDIFPGDYITKQVTIRGTTYDVTWVVADCDYWINKGDNSVPPHHVAIVSQEPIFNANMNATNTTEGGYGGSRMFKETIPACAAGIVSAFGSRHILTFRDVITNIVDNNVASGGYCGWTGAVAPWAVRESVQCNLMTEHMVTGAPHYSSSGIGDAITTRQMSAFRLSERLINYNRQTYWLRNVASSEYFANVNRGGFVTVDIASFATGVRPFALLC